MVEAVRKLREEHANLAKLLDVLERQLVVLDDGGTPDYGIIQSILDYFLSYPDMCHHPKEDLVFRKLRERDAAAAAIVGDILADHEGLAAVVRNFVSTAVHRMRDDDELPGEWLAIMAREFLHSYRYHIEEEETHFFPVALKHLTPEDWADIDSQLVDHDDPLFGDRVERRYEALRDEILHTGRGDRET